jgi:prepilin-type N-terminal cleavage/methylation domain-containing protein
MHIAIRKLRLAICRHTVGSARSARKLRTPNSSLLAPRSSFLRTGMTLIELLVVIVILTTIVAAAIPLMSPNNDDRRLREAARGLNTYITGAQSRSIATNRPYGVALKRLSQDTKRAEDRGVCLEVFYVEQQPPYAGFDANSRVCVAIHPDPAETGKVLIRFVTRGTTQAGLPPGWTSDLFPTDVIRPGDVLEVNGTRFQLLDDLSQRNITIGYIKQVEYFRPPSNNLPAQIVARPLNDSGQQINPRYDDKGNEIGSQPASSKPPAPYWALPAPYKIFRQPTPASDAPYQLPEGTAIDLRASGVGSGDYFYWPGIHDNNDQVMIMFSPEGKVSRVWYNQKFGDDSAADLIFNEPVVDNLYLLVGRRENIPAPAANSDATLQSATFGTPLTDEQRAKLREPLNWLGGGSRWVVIGSQTGRIATIENAFVDMSSVLNNPQKPFDTASQSSEEMRGAQILAAREFTHEMAQVGGR